MKRTLRHVNLALTVSKVDIDSTLDLLTISSGVEDVADSLTLAKWRISHLEVLSVIRIS